MSEEKWRRSEDYIRVRRSGGLHISEEKWRRCGDYLTMSEEK